MEYIEIYARLGSSQKRGVTEVQFFPENHDVSQELTKIMHRYCEDRYPDYKYTVVDNIPRGSTLGARVVVDTNTEQERINIYDFMRYWFKANDWRKTSHPFENYECKKTIKYEILEPPVGYGVKIFL